MSTSLTSYSKGVNGDRDNTAYSVNSRNSNIILNNTSNFGNRAPLTATQATATSQKNQSLQLSGSSSNINNRLPARTTSNTLVFSGTGNTGSNNLNNSTSNLSVNGNLNKPFAHANTSTNVTNASSTSINNNSSSSNSSSSNSNNNRRASASAMNGNSQHLYNQQPVNSLTQGINDMKINQHNNMDNEDSSSQQQQQQWRGSSHAGSSSNAAAAAAAAARPYGNNEPVPNQQSQQPQQPSHSRASSKTISYSAERVIGNGSFGVVFLAKVVETGEVVAIKKVLQDKRFKNRELQIMRMLNNRNVVQMKHCFYSTGDKPDELYLNLVLEYVPDTVYRFCRQFTKNKEHMPLIYVKLFTFQLCRALNYIHSLGVCHRDIKPQNLLIDPVTGVLKLCDFGSAKQLIPGEPNVSYICSRYYRAPELIFGATNYTTAIDTWSLGCVLAELLIGSPLFPGESSVDQLVEIIKVLGTPTREEIEAMNKNYTEFKFPQVKAQSWNKVFRSHVPPEAIDLVTKFLTYIPEKRVLPIEALAHPFFDELRDPNARLPNMRPLPPLFDFTPDELKMLKNPELKSKIFPPHHQFNNL